MRYRKAAPPDALEVLSICSGCIQDNPCSDHTADDNEAWRRADRKDCRVLVAA